MTTDVFISSALAETLPEYIRTNGLDAPDILATLATFSSSQRMPLNLFGQLLDQLHRIHPVPALGLRVGRCTKPQHFGVVGYLAASCSSLEQALRRYARFQTLLMSSLDVESRQQGEAIRFSWGNGIEDITALAAEFSMAAFVNLYQALIGQDIPPLSIELPCPAEPQPSIHEVIMGCPVSFNAPRLALEIHPSLLSMRIATSDPYMRNLFDQQAHAMLEQHPKPDQFLEALQQQIATALQQGEPSAETVARQMGYSFRSFYRQLAKHGLRYRAVLGDVRCKLARMYLADPRLSLAEIALLLGYSEQSAFSRAFRSWMGCAPLVYREGLGTNQ